MEQQEILDRSEMTKKWIRKPTFSNYLEDCNYHMVKTQKNECQGQCISQCGRGNYMRVEDCEFKCKPYKCPNYEICGTQTPLALQSCWGGRCLDCEMMFGNNLQQSNFKKECMVCLENKFLYKLDCPHQLCASCFRKIYLKKKEYHQNKFYESELDVPEFESGSEDENNSSEDENNSSVDGDDDSNQKPKSTYAKCPYCRHKGYTPAWDNKKKILL